MRNTSPSFLPSLEAYDLTRVQRFMLIDLPSLEASDLTRVQRRPEAYSHSGALLEASDLTMVQRPTRLAYIRKAIEKNKSLV